METCNSSCFGFNIGWVWRDCYFIRSYSIGCVVVGYQLWPDVGGIVGMAYSCSFEPSASASSAESAVS